MGVSGGKTLRARAIRENRGPISRRISDKRAARADSRVARAARRAFHNVQAERPASGNRSRLDVVTIAAPISLLIDAPCTGNGT